MESIWVKRTFVALVAAACALLVACAFAQPARAATKRVEVPFETDMTIEWDTSMSYFKGSSTTGTADNRLAIAGLVLSNAAESSQENVKTALNALGFGSVQSEGYSTNDIYNPAVSFAISKSTVGGKYVVACVVRGTSNFNDIMTDVIAAQDGFAVAGSNTFDKLKIYIKGKNASRKKAQQLKSSNTTLWLTGHSLGAATVSVMAQDTGSLAPKNRTFVYAFACPNYATRFASADSYKNIHYYRNYDDAVPNVPVGIGFGKLGVEHVWKYEGVSWEPVLSAKQKLRYDKAYLLLRGKAFKDDDITWHDHLPCTYMAYLLCGMKESEIEECFGGRPAAPKLKKLTSKNAKVKAEWSKAKGADGYVIYAAKSGGDFEQVKELAGAGKTSAKISGLTAGKKYKLYVRAYREVSGQKIYSAGSAEKTIKVAKPSKAKATNTAARKAYMKKMKKWIKPYCLCSFLYTYVDIDGDKVDEAVTQFYNPGNGSGRTVRILDYKGGKAVQIAKHVEYGLVWAKFYKKGKAAIEYGTGHGGEWYSYFKMMNGKLVQVAEKGRESVNGGGSANGPWNYFVNGKEANSEAFSKAISGIASGKAVKTKRVAKWIELNDMSG